MFARLCKSASGFLAIIVAVLIHVTAVLIELVQTSGSNVFYFFYAVTFSASLLLSTACYRKNSLYNKCLVRPLRQNLYLMIFVIFQGGGVVFFLTENLYDIWEEDYAPGDRYTVATYLYLILVYASQILAPFLYLIVAFNIGLFLDRAYEFKLNLRRFCAGLGHYLEEKEMLFRPQTFAVGKKLLVVVGEQQTLKTMFSVPLLAFVGFNFFAAFLCSGSLMRWYQYYTALQKASYVYFFFLHVLSLAFIVEASEAVECEREEAIEYLNQLVVRCCRSGSLSEVVRLKETRKQLSLGFYLHACGFVTLSRRTFVGMVGVLFSYCIILFQFGINSDTHQ